MSADPPSGLETPEKERDSELAHPGESAGADATPEPAENTRVSKKRKAAARRDEPREGFVPRRVAYALSALSGLLYFLAFPGVDLWPLAFVALVPLIIALRGQPPRRAPALGWTAGFTMTMTGFYWLLEMLKVFSGFPLPLCLRVHGDPLRVPGGPHRAARLALRPRRGRGWPAGLAFCARASPRASWSIPLLFPWYYAATVHQVPALIQVAELGGPIAVGLVLVAANLAFAELDPGAPRAPRGRAGACSPRSSASR